MKANMQNNVSAFISKPSRASLVFVSCFKYKSSKEMFQMMNVGTRLPGHCGETERPWASVSRTSSSAYHTDGTNPY